MPISSSRMGSNRSQTGVADTFAGPFKKGQTSPRRMKKFMPKMTKRANKKAH